MKKFFFRLIIVIENRWVNRSFCFKENWEFIGRAELIIFWLGGVGFRD